MAARAPAAPVRDLDAVIADPNMHARGALQTIAHPELGGIVVPHSPMRYAGLPLRPLTPSRPLGADTAAVLRDYLGDRFVDMFCSVKRTEQARFFEVVTELDFDWYLRNA